MQLKVIFYELAQSFVTRNNIMAIFLPYRGDQSEVKRLLILIGVGIVSVL